MTTSEKPTERLWIKWLLVPAAVLIMYALKLRERLYRYRPEPLEQQYGEAGPYRCTSMTVNDGNGQPLYTISYPADHTDPSQAKCIDACPVIVWGNGTNAQPDNYEGLLNHLAGWGFVVIDGYCRNTGTGKEIADTVRYIRQENVREASPFYGKLRVDCIGAVGQSQGATGVLNAGKHLEEPLQTVVTIALPALKWCDAKDVYDIGALQVPLFLMAGTHDFIISPESANRRAYLGIRAEQPAVMAMTKAADHLESMGDGGMHRGYLTAWLCYRLMGDQRAAAVFTGERPELYRNKGWRQVRSQNLNDPA